MPSASGYVVSKGKGPFLAAFHLDNGMMKSFHGEFTTAVPVFIAKVAEVKYNYEMDLEGDYDIGDNAVLGPVEFNLPLEGGNGSITITGEFEPNMISEEIAVTGTGKWTTS